MLEERESIGKRVRRARLRLGMTQADLATSVGKTQGWVSKVEKGDIELDRTGIINQLAAALHCHPNDLMERPYVAGKASENQWQVCAASILRELRRYDLAPVFDGRPHSAAKLWLDTQRLHRLRDTAANVAVMKVLPDMVRESRALAEVSSGREREEAYAIYAVECKFAHTAAHALPDSRRGHHHMDLARAWLWDGKRDKALKELETAEKIAPQLVRNHPIGRATLRKIVYAERSATREKLRRMSDRFHLDG